MKRHGGNLSACYYQPEKATYYIYIYIYIKLQLGDTLEKAELWRQ